MGVYPAESVKDGRRKATEDVNEAGCGKRVQLEKELAKA